jgi:hypothetical protein
VRCLRRFPKLDSSDGLGTDVASAGDGIDAGRTPIRATRWLAMTLTGRVLAIIYRVLARFSKDPAARRANHQNLSSPLSKNISLNLSGQLARLTREEGRIAIVTNAGWDAVDAAAPARKVTAGRVLDP